MAYQQGFSFDQGSLGRNLAVFDEECRGFLALDLKVHEQRAEETMKVRAPWKDDTGFARQTLWADSDVHEDRMTLVMGHGAEYGIYLEESNEGRFQIIMPTLLATARSFMRSLERMFLQMQTKTPVSPAISPGVGTRPGTSQGVKERFLGADSKPNVSRRSEVKQTIDRLGRVAFRHVGKFISKSEAKRLQKNERARQRYAVKKASGTLKTKKTKRG